MQTLLIYLFVIIQNIFLFLFLFYLPGRTISENLFKIKNNVLVNFFTGYGVFVLLIYFFFYFQVKISIAFAIILSVGIIAAAISSSLAKDINNLKFFLLNFSKQKFSTFILIIVVISIFSINKINFNHHGSDYWSLMSFIRSFLDDGFFSNKIPFYGLSQSAYPSNAFFAYVGIVKFLNPDISIIHIYNIMSGFLIVITIFLNTYILSNFCKDKQLSWMIICFILSLGLILNSSFLNILIFYSFYPKFFSVTIILPFIIYIFFSKNFHITKVKFFLPIYFLSFTNASSINLIILSVVVLSFLIVQYRKNYFNNYVNCIISSYLIVLIISFLLYKNFFSSPTGVLSTYSYILEENPILYNFFNLGFVYSFRFFFSSYYSFYLILSILLLINIGTLWKNKLIKFYIVCFLITIFLVFNPYFISVLNLFFPVYFLERLNFIFINFGLMSALVVMVIKKYKIFNWKVFLLITIFVINLLQIKNNLINIYYNKDLLAYIELEKYLSKNINNNQLIVTDKFTSLKIMSFKKTLILITNEKYLGMATPITNFLSYNLIYDRDETIKVGNILKNLKEIKCDYFIVNSKISGNFNALSLSNLDLIYNNSMFYIYKIVL